ncbi:hypothetical protein AKN90_08305 [Thiopseudomonas alkaliphila]|uniref:tetratricopeptide repeat protein n=1 Tax=Thiopseudomonas alkaliphila TaxID=1697053 RepID=UPI00069D8111|nr:tetratricopeptide repeat protein [Thiopseudomonas alkaliphila]AKX55707.1 hypothetical protein AKN90_08305 [Thiopseudomonas alkaliphila]
MIIFSRTLVMGLLLSVPFISRAESNSLIVPQANCELSATHSQLQETAAPNQPLLTQALTQQLNYCTRLAEQGDADAQYQLGWYFESRPEPDLNQAIHWFEQASLQGHATAQWRLGLLFFHGQGVPSNKVQSFIVLKMASINGEEQAIDDADRVASSMQSQELELANQMLSQIFYNYMQELLPEPELSTPLKLTP